MGLTCYVPWKSPCNGIDGTLKHEAAHAVLQTITTGFILTTTESQMMRIDTEPLLKTYLV